VTLAVQIQISNIISRAHKTLLDFGLITMTPQKERTTDVLLKGFNTELDSLHDPSLSGMRKSDHGILYTDSAEYGIASI
jgi:hypothetical protein